MQEWVRHARVSRPIQAGARDKFGDCRCLSAVSAQRVEADDEQILPKDSG